MLRMLAALRSRHRAVHHGRVRRPLHHALYRPQHRLRDGDLFFITLCIVLNTVFVMATSLHHALYRPQHGLHDADLFFIHHALYRPQHGLHGRRSRRNERTLGARPHHRKLRAYI